jgi:cation transporter-like permease
MSVATLLKYSANILMGAALVKRIAADMAAEVRRDVGSLRSPYPIAGAATVMGIVAGILLARHRRGRA